MPRRPKVFGIGLNKTGTTSTSRAVRDLGFRTIHNGPVARQIESNRQARRRLLTGVEKYDAFFDVEPVTHGFAQLDQEHPGSLFILTTRDLDGWLVSRERHVIANQQAAADGAYRGSLLTINREAWRDEYEAHHAAVADYFAGRRDLLMYRVDEGWAPLARFLGHPVPAVPFPHENTAEARGSTVEPMTERVRRVARRLDFWSPRCWVCRRRIPDRFGVCDMCSEDANYI